MRRVQAWMPLVRAAVAQSAQPFTADDVCRAMKLDTTIACTRRQSIFDCLDRLVGRGELAKQSSKPGQRRAKSSFTRTSTFRAEEFDFEAQTRAGVFLQGLALQWGSKRNSHAAAD